VLFNDCIENSGAVNFQNVTGPNTILGNFAFNATASGLVNNSNYSVVDAVLSGKVATAAQNSSFIDRPTYWTNINMLP